MRVVHVLQTLAPGGAQDLLVELARVAGGAGIALEVASLLPVAADLDVARELRALDVPVHDLGLRGTGDPRGLSSLARVVGDARPDVLHSHGRHADLLGALVARRRHVPLVSTIHLVEQPGGWGGRGKRALGGLARGGGASRVVTVSEAQRRWYLRTFRTPPHRVVTIRNGVAEPAPTSRAAVLELRAQLGVPCGAVLATSLGLLRPDRGHETLLRAARHVSPDVVLLIAGDGPLRRELELQAAGAACRVVFAGFRRDVDQLLAASDVVVQSSLTDALPTSLLRALAAARPVVASDVDGIPEIVMPDAGMLVPPGDPAALAIALRRVAADAGLRRRLGRAGRRRFEAEFDSRRWADRLRRMYEDVLRNPAVAA